MEIRELRIGNWVLNSFGEYVKVYNISEVVVSGYHTETLKPIPLTEEILFKCGFEKINQMYCLGKMQISLKNTLGYKKGRIYYKSWCIIENQPEHLHQLQNLYYALTQKELEIKL